MGNQQNMVIFLQEKGTKKLLVPNAYVFELIISNVFA